MSEKATAAATGEIDFFNSPSGDKSPSDNNKQLFHRHSSFRGLQNAISKMDPQLVKSVMDSNRSTSVPCTPKTADQSTCSVPAQPALNKTNSGNSAFRSGESNFPLTIFYNGRVYVFNLPVEKAEMVLKLAVQACSRNVESEVAAPPSNPQHLLNTSLNGDLPQTRRKSLGVFLERRKERVTSIPRYQM